MTVFPAALRPAVASPCVGVCVLQEASGICQGCARTVAEIASWLAFSPAERCAIMEALPARKASPPRDLPRYFHV